MVKAYSYVRLSSEAQLKGDGRRRQIEKSRKYAAIHGLDLDESLSLSERAVSAFKGRNAISGSLATFLEDIKNGRVERGSYLLIESIDRLSRQEILKSLALFMELLAAGIVIVTLTDERVYRAEATQESDLFIMIGIMSRAHEESRTKSIRIGERWENKRKNLADKKLTAMCPRWLTLSTDKTTFLIDEERASVVRKIFADASSGIGMFTIARRFNSEKVPTFGDSNGWHQSYINKILSNRAVFGEFQPHKIVDGVRKPEGESVKGYFPAIIDEETFYIAQGGRHQRRVSGAGRKGPSISNLFTGLLCCNDCGQRMHYENKGSGPKGGRYLVCEAGYRKHGCHSTRWRYEHFEASFLSFVEELDLGALLADKESASKRAMIESSITSFEAKLAVLIRERERVYNWIRMPTFNSDFTLRQFEQCELDIRSTETALTEKQSELQSHMQTFTEHYQDKDELKRLVLQIRNREGVDVYKARAQIVSRLKGVVTQISVATAGDAPRKYQLAQDFESFEEMVGFETTDDMRFFSVGFRDGTYRIVYPNPTDPSAFEAQVQGDAETMNVLRPSKH